jgi:hypothetical protein
MPRPLSSTVTEVRPGARLVQPPVLLRQHEQGIPAQLKDIGTRNETPTASEIPAGNRWRNQNYVGNVMCKLSTHLTLAWEYRRMFTDCRNLISAYERGDNVNLAVVYMF